MAGRKRGGGTDSRSFVSIFMHIDAIPDIGNRMFLNIRGGRFGGMDSEWRGWHQTGRGC